MEEDTGIFVGIDVAKLRNAVAVAEPGRDGEVRYYGEVDASEVSMRQLFKKLASRHGKLTVCCEAGPTGYGLHRLTIELGHECMVVAPSLIPRKARDRIKTNRRDALALARLLRAGDTPRGQRRPKRLGRGHQPDPHATACRTRRQAGAYRTNHSR